MVMVTTWLAELKVGNNTVGRVRLGDVLQVSREQGEWLWIGKAGGWIERKNVVPLEKAIDFFTRKVNRNLTAEAYHQRALAYAALKHFDKALADLNVVLQKDPRNWAAYYDRGTVYRRLGRSKEALADFDRIISAGKAQPIVYTSRGLVRFERKDDEGALADFNAAIRLDAKFAPAWEAGGTVRQAQGNYEKAIRNYQQAIAADERFVPAYNNLAWLLATCPAGKYRNGAQAVQYATKACELTGYQDAGMLDTLAAALAEAGRFKEAVQRAEEALALADPVRKKAIEERLKLYRAGKPYREESVRP